MRSIQVDDEVYAELKRLAEPFVDTTPNTVLRRVLLKREEETVPVRKVIVAPHTRRNVVKGNENQTRSTDEFVREMLSSQFVGKFRTRSPYRLMFESDRQLVYIQNFNSSDADTLWYRLTERPLKVLRGSSKEALVCLANPSDDLAYMFPLNVIDQRSREAGWERPYYEVSIDHSSRRWRELDWDIRSYLRKNVTTRPA